MGSRIPRYVHAALTAVSISVLLAGAASARSQTIAPPGNSAIGQYVEVVPTASGGQPSNSVHPGGGGTNPGDSAGGGGTGGGPGTGGRATGGGGAVPASTLRALAAHGTVGKATAALAQGTAPGSSSGSAGHGPSALNHGGSSGSSPFSAVLAALGGSSNGGGLGVLLPIILIGTLLAAGAFSLFRRRRAA